MKTKKTKKNNTIKKFHKYTWKLYQRNQDDYKDLTFDDYRIHIHESDLVGVMGERLKSNGFPIFKEVTSTIDDDERKLNELGVPTKSPMKLTDDVLDEIGFSVWNDFHDLHLNPPVSTTTEIILTLGNHTKYPLVIDDDYRGQTIGCLYEGQYVLTRKFGNDGSPFDRHIIGEELLVMGSIRNVPFSKN